MKKFYPLLTYSLPLVSNKVIKNVSPIKLTQSSQNTNKNSPTLQTRICESNQPRSLFKKELIFYLTQSTQKFQEIKNPANPKTTGSDPKLRLSMTTIFKIISTEKIASKGLMHLNLTQICL